MEGVSCKNSKFIKVIIPSLIMGNDWEIHKAKSLDAVQFLKRVEEGFLSKTREPDERIHITGPPFMECGRASDKSINRQ